LTHLKAIFEELCDGYEEVECTFTGRARLVPLVRRAVTFAVPPSAPVVPCRSCRAPVVWIVTDKGKRMPVNADGEDGRGESHFATCPHAADWRKGR
jgi:hypothetical protein